MNSIVNSHSILLHYFEEYFSVDIKKCEFVYFYTKVYQLEVIVLENRKIIATFYITIIGNDYYVQHNETLFYTDINWLTGIFYITNFNMTIVTKWGIIDDTFIKYNIEYKKDFTEFNSYYFINNKYLFKKKFEKKILK